MMKTERKSAISATELDILQKNVRVHVGTARNRDTETETVQI